jgi:hypothetical protein
MAAVVVVSFVAFLLDMPETLLYSNFATIPFRGGKMEHRSSERNSEQGLSRMALLSGVSPGIVGARIFSLYI